MKDKSQNEMLLQVVNLKKHFPIKKGITSRITGYVKAVDGVSFYVKRGETLGIVGESGCGKSTTGKVILRLMEPTSGEAIFQGKDIFALNKQELRSMRRDMQIVFQDPFASLNPRMTVQDIIAEPLRTHGVPDGSDIKGKIKELLQVVGLDTFHLNRYPHEFSGGQRQRIGVARALSVQPKLIILDEPVSALDVSIQSQIINLFQDLQRQFQLTYIFIAHDLAVVKHISDRVGVMYLGRVVETASVKQIFNQPLHPYTEALLSAVPVPNPDATIERIVLAGDVPNPSNIPSGCRFHTRCRFKMAVCEQTEPEWKDVGEAHYVACHLHQR